MKAWILFLVSLLTVGCGCEEIEAGHVGVVKKWSAPVAQVGEGFHWTSIGEDIESINTRAVPFSVKTGAGSKDLQRVSVEVTVQYAVNGMFALKMLQKIGNGDAAQALIAPAVHESIKATMAGYTAEELISKRAEVKHKVDQSLKEAVNTMLLTRDLPNLIDLVNIAITDFDFSKEFNESIEAKVKAEQDSLRAENEKTKRITEAEAHAAEVTKAAEAEAIAIESKSKAKADAIKREMEALRGNQDYIKLRTVEKWNGDLPKYSGSVQPWIQLPAN